MARLTGGYFGTRGPDMFSEYFLKQVDAAGRFIDITAGTGQFPYYLATERDKQIGLVERCPYVGYLLHSIFSGRPLEQVEWEPEAKRGYLFARGHADVKLAAIINKHVARTVDGFAQANVGNLLALHCIGRAVNRLFLYRGMTLSKKAADGRATIDIQPQEVLDVARKTYDRMAKLRLDRVRHWVQVGDSVCVLKMMPAHIIKGSTVYADPAWPYAKQFGSSNPYRMAYEFTSSIMLQKQLTLSKIWEIDKLDQIHADIASWVDTAFARGAKQFILCSQDTNSPTEGELKEWVHERWRITKHERSADFSSFANRKYVTYWFYLQPR